VKTLITGIAGFIGFHVAADLMARGHEIVGVDSMNDYYDPSLKEARLRQLAQRGEFFLHRGDLADRTIIPRLRADEVETVVHLAAQAGVRYSAQNPAAYVDANLVGFGNVLELCRTGGVRHLVYASSSSVYGANTKLPFATTDRADHPISFYAATKRANELMAHAYAHNFPIRATGLRFFTAYGPWGRPDMAYFTFTRKILAGELIDVYAGGDSSRDYTYIDDVVEVVRRVVEETAPRASSEASHRIYNVGSGRPVPLAEFIATLEDALGVSARRQTVPAQPGDMTDTFADVSELERYLRYRPSTPLADGIRTFVAWYRAYYGVEPSG
jgi:UDP-glucuronate 4-epimerase